MDAQTYIAQYLQGYYPEFGREQKPLYWERRDQRAILLLNEEAAARAKLLRKKAFMKRPKARYYTLQHNTNFAGVLAALGDERIKPNTWIHDEITDIYQILHSAGYVHTVEAYDGEQLIGATLGLQLGKAHLLETMFYTVSSASVLCLTDLAERLYQSGFHFIDFQNPHHAEHPNTRLGETVIPIQEYLTLLHQATQAA